MRMKSGEKSDGTPEFVNVTWSDHRIKCAKCQTVDIERTATIANACAEGAPLLAEKLVDIQRPAQKEKAEAVRQWAKKAGVFKGV